MESSRNAPRVVAHQRMWRSTHFDTPHRRLDANPLASCARPHASPHFWPACRSPARDSKASAPPASITPPPAPTSQKTLGHGLNAARNAVLNAPRAYATPLMNFLYSFATPLYSRATAHVHASGTESPPGVEPGHLQSYQAKLVSPMRSQSLPPVPPALLDCSQCNIVYSRFTGLTLVSITPSTRSNMRQPPPPGAAAPLHRRASGRRAVSLGYRSLHQTHVANEINAKTRPPIGGVGSLRRGSVRDSRTSRIPTHSPPPDLHLAVGP